MRRTAACAGRWHSARHQRGISLVEAMIAFLVMGIGMLSIIGVQMTMRFNGEISKQRSEAVRLAQEEMESLRTFSTLLGVGDTFDNIVDLPAADVAGYTSNTTFRVTRRVDTVADPGYKTATITVDWTDRYNAVQAITLSSTITAIDPLLSGALSIALSDSPVRNPLSRSVEIPTTAHDLGDGRSALKPSPTGTVAFVFNNASGVITSICIVPAASTTESLTVGSLTGCVATTGYLLAGFVRFVDTVPVTAADAEDPVGLARDLDLVLTLSGGTYPAPGFRCYDDSPTAPVPTLTTVAYYCAVFPDPGTLQWSGSLSATPIGWAYGLTPAESRLCRYSADYDADGTLANDEHPQDYEDVPGNLLNQNFLVVRGDSPCPADVAADPSVGDFVNTNTEQVEPAAP